jgi:large subunit ribosomal protein L4
VSTVDVLDATGTKTGTVELPDAVFGVQLNIPLIHQVVVAQQAAARQGTHSTKTRGEVRGGGRKPYRQKGTGRARQGSIRAPQFAGGGVVHGPKPRDYSQRTPKKMKAAALRGALSDRARHGRVHVLSALVDGDTPSTKAAVAALASVTDRTHVLVVLQRGDDNTWLSLRNIPTVHLLHPDQLNTYDVLVSDDVVFTPGALADFLGTPLEITEVKPVKKAAAKRAPAKKAAEPAGEAEAAEQPAEQAAEQAAEKPAKKAPEKKAAAKKAAEPAEEAEAADQPAEKPAKKAARKAPAKKTTEQVDEAVATEAVEGETTPDEAAPDQEESK